MRGFAYNNESKQLKNVITTEITGPGKNPRHS